MIDYGVGNLLGIRRALEHCGATVTLVDNATAVASAERLLLPGVGAFAHAMNELRGRGMLEAVREWATRERPLLGICLGMQLLCTTSEEFGLHQGMGLIPGRVVPVPATAADGRPHKIPHIGWSELAPAPSGPDWSDGILADTEIGESVYFVHSFMAVTDQPADMLAVTHYDGVPVPAVIGRDLTYGCQFHPEKSGEVGLSIIRRFLSL